MTPYESLTLIVAVFGAGAVVTGAYWMREDTGRIVDAIKDVAAAIKGKSVIGG